MAETIRIGMPVPLSGTYEVEASEQVRGAQMAIQNFNESGGLDGRLAELFPRDTKLQVAEAGRLTRELIEKEKVHFVVGALGAPDMPLISAACHENGIIYNAISVSDGIIEKANRRPFTFHEAPNTHMTLGAVGRYAFSHFGSRVSMLSVDNEYGHSCVRALIHVGHQIGLEVLDNLVHPISEANLKPYLEKILKSRPEVLIHPADAGGYQHCSRTDQQARLHTCGVSYNSFGCNGFSRS